MSSIVFQDLVINGITNSVRCVVDAKRYDNFNPAFWKMFDKAFWSIDGDGYVPDALLIYDESDNSRSCIAFTTKEMLDILGMDFDESKSAEFMRTWKIRLSSFYEGEYCKLLIGPNNPVWILNGKRLSGVSFKRLSD